MTSAKKMRTCLPLGLATICLMMAALNCARFAAAAETASLAIGEYPPFVGKNELDNGVTAAIVNAVFKTQKIDVRYAFLPWNRGYHETRLGRYIGTFPYLKTPEREAAFLYSHAFYSDQFRMFVRKSDAAAPDWQNKAICVPLGYDTSQLNDFITRHHILLERPSVITNCFLMLDRHHVDAVWVSELVGADAAKKLFGKDTRTSMLDLNLVGPVDYYFIVSRKLPDAQKWLKRFNTGLAAIQKNGTYQQIVNDYTNH